MILNSLICQNLFDLLFLLIICVVSGNVPISIDCGQQIYLPTQMTTYQMGKLDDIVFASQLDRKANVDAAKPRCLFHAQCRYHNQCGYFGF